jgi:DNA-binding protein YbaB
VAAHADAKAKSEPLMAEEMSRVTGGMALPPGMKLPF